MKKVYSQEELSKLAKGVFRDDKTSPSIYANEEGTFLNADQYEKRKKDGTHKEFRFEFKNPSVKRVMVVDDQSAVIDDLKAQLAGKDRRIAELSDEISGYESKLSGNESKVAQLEEDLGKAHVIISERDAELATLRMSIAGPAAPEPIAAPAKAPRKGSSKTAKS